MQLELKQQILLGQFFSRLFMKMSQRTHISALRSTGVCNSHCKEIDLLRKFTLL